jgi:hypothetical protein
MQKYPANYTYSTDVHMYIVAGLARSLGIGTAGGWGASEPEGICEELAYIHSVYSILVYFHTCM